MSNATDTFSTLKAQAVSDMARYPQYQGHFDGYVLVKLTRAIKTKMGLAFEKGEYAIAHAHPRKSVNVNGKESTFFTVYSPKNRCDTSVPASSIEVV